MILFNILYIFNIVLFTVFCIFNIVYFFSNVKEFYLFYKWKKLCKILKFKWKLHLLLTKILIVGWYPTINSSKYMSHVSHLIICEWLLFSCFKISFFFFFSRMITYNCLLLLKNMIIVGIVVVIIFFLILMTHVMDLNM